MDGLNDYKWFNVGLKQTKDLRNRKDRALIATKNPAIRYSTMKRFAVMIVCLGFALLVCRLYLSL